MAAEIEKPSVKNFFRAFGSRWFTFMCGPLTVPFAVAAVFLPGMWQKTLLVTLAALCAVSSAYFVWRIERLAKNEELARALPRIEILWKPTNETYRFEFPQPEDHNILFRILVMNSSRTHPLTGVRVRMESLTPSACPCIPACLRLMNDFGQPLTERFNLTAGGIQFVDVIQQNLKEPAIFLLWHVVTPIPVQVKAQPYQFTIVATADDAPPASRDFEMRMDGGAWTMIMTHQT
jgi:hypothetical protein